MGLKVVQKVIQIIKSHSWLLWPRLVSYQRRPHSHVWQLMLAVIWCLSWEFCLTNYIWPVHMAWAPREQLVSMSGPPYRIRWKL